MYTCHERLSWRGKEEEGKEGGMVGEEKGKGREGGGRGEEGGADNIYMMTVWCQLRLPPPTTAGESVTPSCLVGSLYLCV